LKRIHVKAEQRTDHTYCLLKLAALILPLVVFWLTGTASAY